MQTLVLGLGNPILTDDGIGVHVVREVAARGPHDKVDVAEASVGGLRLLDKLAGYKRVILVDAILTSGGMPGTIYHLQSGDLCSSLHSGSTHDLSLSGALALGRELGITLPDDENLVIVAVEVEDVLTFGEECTVAVKAALPLAVRSVMDEIARS